MKLLLGSFRNLVLVSRALRRMGIEDTTTYCEDEWWEEQMISYTFLDKQLSQQVAALSLQKGACDIFKNIHAAAIGAEEIIFCLNDIRAPLMSHPAFSSPSYPCIEMLLLYLEPELWAKTSFVKLEGSVLTSVDKCEVESFYF